jgi:hypothetical protein
MSVHPSISELASLVDALILTPEWTALDEQRGEDFHRWRRESSVMAGVDENSGFTVPFFDESGKQTGGASVSEFQTYTAADGLEEAVASIATAALHAVASILDRLVDTFGRALEPLSGGSIRWSPTSRQITTFSWTPGNEWKPVDCSCCK